MLAARLRLAVICALGLALAASACSDNDDEQQDADPQDVVDQAASQFAETDSARFTLSIDGTILIDESGLIALSGVEGEIERPSSAFAEASVQFAGSNVTMELVAVDGQMYLRNIISGEWEEAPTDLQYDPSRIFDDEEGIVAILDQLEDLDVQGRESVDGDDAWHLTGTVPTSAVRSLTGDFFEGDTLDVEAWIATNDHRILRVNLHDPDSDEASSWELELTDHNEPVDISEPELG